MILPRLKYIIFPLLLFIFCCSGTHAVESEIIPETSQTSEIDTLEFVIPGEIYYEDTLELDISDLKRDLTRLLPNETFRFEWDIPGAATRIGEQVSFDFERTGRKTMYLKVFLASGDLLLTRELQTVVYQKSIPVFIQDSLEERQLENFIALSENEGIFSYAEAIQKDAIEETNFLDLIENYRKINGPKSDYIVLWGDKEFLSSTTSRITKEISSQNSGLSLNVLMISPHNLTLLESYLKNFVVEKPWIKQIILMGESSRFQIFSSADSLKQLQENLRSNGHEHMNINIRKDGINNALFISKFINNLSNQGFGSDGIYLIILIPFLFTLLVIVKHLIGLSPIGVLIPIGLTLMMFKIGILFTIIIFSFFIIFNLILARILNTQTLLYTPKISFCIILNIIGVIILINSLILYGVVDLNINNALYIIIYIIILEKLINVILSKEFNEYRPGLMNSILIGLMGYIIFSFDGITTLILSYPEAMILLIPINYLIGKFSGLRVTEYFRFKDVIRTVEEEE